jgi:hypothetical protein
MLHAACYDCHSSETLWPWYSHIAPMSWLIASDVKEGREHLNLSDWPNDNPMRAAKRLENMSDEISSGEMSAIEPLPAPVVTAGAPPPAATPATNAPAGGQRRGGRGGPGILDLIVVGK